MTSAALFQLQSFFIYCLMIFGISKRKVKKIHVPVMSAVLIWDILLILQIELTRSAIDKASKALTNSLLLNIHVSFAVSSVIFYFLLIYTGRKLLAGDQSIRQKHRIFGWTAFVLRTLTLATSFFAVTQN
jgi:ABC-type sulfate transport system permease subunit